VYLLTTEGNVQNAQKYSNVKVADPTVIYEFAINPDKSHIIPENVLYWVKFLTEIENNRLKFSACKGIMFDTNISYSDTNEGAVALANIFCWAAALLYAQMASKSVTFSMPFFINAVHSQASLSACLISGCFVFNYQNLCPFNGKR
jgi:hypothetical protein